ncbi:MAG: MBL fold metallo-hydrolase, partial [Patescibacteria group bacterium]
MNEFKLQVFKVGALQTNCYFVIKEDKCLIFDAGDSADFILDKILELKLDPLAIFTSHGHFDHVMAVGEIQLSYDIPFYISKKDLFLLDRAKET